MILKCLLAVLVPSLASTGRFPGPDERIVGGYGIPIEKAPYQVAILVKDVQSCGGAIYSERIVLTAAHCFNRTYAKDYSVRIGSSFPNIGGQVVPVQEAFPHEDFASQKFGVSNDIAVFYLREPLKLNTPRTQTIKLAEKSPETGSNCRVTGWGFTFPGSNMAAPNLLATDLKISDFNNCRETYLGNITTNMICATAPGKDSCQGDSGGPLISLPDRELIGIVSFGKGCATPGYPGIYTSIAHYRDWISTTISRIQKSQINIATGK